MSEKWTLEGMTYAHDCPECHRQGGSSLEHQSLYLERSNSLRIENGFECLYCCASWFQTIIIRLGAIVSNTAETH